jgi:hypothetical protein
MDSITQQERAQLEEVFAAIYANKSNRLKVFYTKIYKRFFIQTKIFATRTNHKVGCNFRFKNEVR